MPLTAAIFVSQGFTYPVREYFLEDVFEMTGYLVGKTSKWAKRKNAGGIVERTAVTTQVSKHEKLLSSDGKTEEIVPESWEEDEERMQLCDVRRGRVHSSTSHEDNMYEGDTEYADEDWMIPGKSDSTEDDDLKKALEAERICQDRIAEASKIAFGLFREHSTLCRECRRVAHKLRPYRTIYWENHQDRERVAKPLWLPNLLVIRPCIHVRRSRNWELS